MTQTQHPVQLTSDGERVTTDRRRLPVWSTTALALGAAILTWAVEAPLAGVELTVDAGDSTRVVGIASVAVSAVIVAVAGALVARAIARRAARPRRTWLVTGTMVGVLSLVGPFGQAATPGAIVALVLLHLVVAIAVVPTLALALPSRRDA